MRVLIIHRYFWPDTPPYGWMLRAIAGRWVQDGHEVTVLTSQPSYSPDVGKQARREDLDGFTVRRVGLLPETKKNWVLRSLNLGLFMLRAIAHIISRRHGYDVVMAATTPPVMIAWAASLAARLRGARFVYHCQDIHPELMRYAGLMGDSAGYRFLRRRDRATVDRAARVVVLSRDMAQTLAGRTGHELRHVAVINNFTVPDYGADAPSETPEARPRDGIFRVLFAGNLGFFQGLEAVIDAAQLLRERDDIEFVFLGEGAAKERLVELAGDCVGRTVHFLGYRPQKEAEEFVSRAGLSLITLGPDIYRTAFPSKTMTYLKVGSPILAIIEGDSELARLVRDRQLGYVAAPGDASMVADHVQVAASSPEAMAAMRENARTACEELFSEESRLQKWSALLREDVFPSSPQPVFLIGAGRSGTKFVRDMLGAANDVAAVPYDVGYVWRTGNESVDHDELDPSTVTGELRSYIRRTLLRLAGATETSKVLLEKSVPNSLRVAFLHAVYPDAKFVHLVRDGRAVVESSIRQWQAPAATGYLLGKLRYFPWSNFRYAFWYIKNQVLTRSGSNRRIWGPRYRGMDRDVVDESLETVCARQWRVCVSRAREQLATIPDDQVMTIHYEDLVNDEENLRALCEFAGIHDWASVRSWYADHVRPQALDKWEANLSGQQKAEILSEIRDARAELGYAE